MPNLHIAIIGATGGLGSAFVKLLSQDPSNTIYAFARSKIVSVSPNIHGGSIDLADEHSLGRAAEMAASHAPLDLVIVATGILHDATMKPEKTLHELSAVNFERNFWVNTIGPALVAKHFLPKLRRDKRALFAVLSARFGSISDNRLGGWYAYRASKAALNMLIKTASIEVARRQKHTIVVGLHPGTVATRLSKPFQKHIAADKLFNTDYSIAQMLKVLEGLSTEDSGKIFAWDGHPIPY